MVFTDGSAGLSFRSTAIDVMVVSGSRGRGTANGESVQYRVAADDLSGSGSEHTFEIALSNGYLAAGTVRHGDVEIECEDDGHD